MLDDLKFIHHTDTQDALGIAQKQWQQLETEVAIPDMRWQYTNVVFAGMGGSALAASLATTWPGVNVPFEIVRGYDIPAYVSENTLFIASSYSGNTEETLSALQQAMKKTKHIVCIANGGKLIEVAEKHNYPLAKLPDTNQPRFATLAGLKCLSAVLEAAGVAQEKHPATALESAANTLQKGIEQWLPTVPTRKNSAKQLAKELMGKSPVVYAGPKMFPAAYKWKISLNENAKNIAWCNQLPEFNHNEFLGWTSHPIDKPYEVIDLRSSFEHEQVTKRFDVSARLLSGQRPAPHAIDAEGKTLLDQLLWLVAYGDFVSLYLALLNGLDPTPVDIIEKLKKELVK